MSWGIFGHPFSLLISEVWTTRAKMSSSMYKFVKGSRLFMQGTREGADYDNVHDTFRPTVSAATVDRSRGGSNGHGPMHVMGEDDDLGRMPLSLLSLCPF